MSTIYIKEQGAIISPLLSNIYLDDFDKFIDNKCLKYIRYSDDLIILNDSKDVLLSIMEEIKSFLNNYNLILNEEKSNIVHIEKGFDFLGYHFNSSGKSIPIKANSTLNERLESIWIKYKNKPIEIKIKKCTEVLEGWRQYYKEIREPVNIFELVTNVYNISKRKVDKLLLYEIMEIRFNYVNIYKDITQYLVNVWSELGKDDMVLREYEQYFELDCLDTNKNIYNNINYILELNLNYQKLIVNTQEDTIKELIQTYSDLNCYNKAKKLSEINNQLNNSYILINNISDSFLKNHIELNDKDLQLYMGLFVGREDIYCIEESDNFNKRKLKRILLPLTKNEIKKHLSGDCIISTYVQRVNKSVKFAVFDIDISKKILLENKGDKNIILEYLKRAQLVSTTIKNQLSKLGINCYIEYSGYRGYHVWIFFNDWISTKYINKLQDIIIERLDLENDIIVECFPNKTRIGKEQPGQALKLPWGNHIITNEITLFLDDEFLPINNQPQILEDIKKTDITKIKEIVNLSDKIDTDSSEVYSSEEFTNLKDNIKIILNKCNLIRYICSKAVYTKYLSHYERLVLSYIFGHLGTDGKNFIHQIMKHTLNYQYSITQKFIDYIPSNPISCTKLREQFSQVTAEIGCNCNFNLPKNCYPSPILHIKETDNTLNIYNKCTSKITNTEKNVQSLPIIQVEKIATKLLNLKKQRRTIDKSIEKYEKELVNIFDNLSIECLEIDKGLLKRKRNEKGYEWIIEI